MAAKKKEELKIIEPEVTQVPNPSFYANEFTYHVGGRDVFLDFKNITPRFNKNQPSEVTEHNVVIIDTILFKKLITLGFKFIEEFEKKYGEIKEPPYLEKFGQESLNQLKQIQEKLKKDDTSPEYFG